nr:immunoglobulin light chain junction region [Macaca mulatta]MOX10936.1 immunoglobulin light chain junction region [Macaca mulatta]
CMQALEFPLTV